MDEHAADRNAADKDAVDTDAVDKDAVDKDAVVAALEEIAALMEILGENPFRVRSFRTGARTIQGLRDDLADRVAAGTLQELPGIGTTLAEVITELVETGSSSHLKELRRRVPPGLLELNAIPGLGPKRARAIHDALGIESIDALEQACREGKVASLPGFGKKTEEKILAGIAYHRRVAGRFLIDEALAAATALVEFLRADDAVEVAEVAGSIRRRRETVKDIDCIAVVADPGRAPEVMERFTSRPEVGEVISRGTTRSSVRLASP